MFSSSECENKGGSSHAQYTEGSPAPRGTLHMRRWKWYDTMIQMIRLYNKTSQNFTLPTAWEISKNINDDHLQFWEKQRLPPTFKLIQGFHPCHMCQ